MPDRERYSYEQTVFTILEYLLKKKQESETKTTVSPHLSKKVVEKAKIHKLNLCGITFKYFRLH